MPKEIIMGIVILLLFSPMGGVIGKEVEFIQAYINAGGE